MYADDFREWRYVGYGGTGECFVGGARRKLGVSAAEMEAESDCRTRTDEWTLEVMNEFAFWVARGRKCGIELNVLEKKAKVGMLWEGCTRKR